MHAAVWYGQTCHTSYTSGPPPPHTTTHHIDQVFHVLVVHVSYLCLDNVVACPLCARTVAGWFRVQKTAKVSQLQCSDTVSGDFFKGPVHRYRAEGRVHRDTAPIIRCLTFGGMDRHVIKTHRQNHHHHKACDSSTRFLVCETVMIQNPADGSCAERALGSGSARRRRERRLRSFLRHERMTVAAWSWPQPCTALRSEVQGPRRTTLHGARRRSTPGRTRCSSSCSTKTPPGCGRPVWSSRRGHRSGFRGTPWSRWPTSLPWCRLPRCSCAADGGPGCLDNLNLEDDVFGRCSTHGSPDFRAGYRSAQVHHRRHPHAYLGS